jgi:Na+-driven multidrug efflux pump
MALPAVLALAADPLLAMVDTGIVGQLGQSELAALGVNNSIFGFSFVVFNFLSTATTPAVAAALGAGDKAKAGATVSQV